MKTKPFSELTFTVFDIETTGFNPEYDKIVEIAAVQIKPNYVLDLKNTFSTLVNPERNIPAKAYDIHKISNDMVKDMPAIDKILPMFIDFAENTVIAGHNINKFDMSFINKALAVCNLHFSCLQIDTLKLSKKYLKHLPKHKLDSLIDYFNIQLDIGVEQRHRALFDAACCAAALLEFFKILNNNGIYNIVDLYAALYKK